MALLISGGMVSSHMYSDLGMHPVHIISICTAGELEELSVTEAGAVAAAIHPNKIAISAETPIHTRPVLTMMVVTIAALMDIRKI